MVAGLHPTLPWSYYTELLRRIRSAWPELTIKAFTAIEYHYWARKFGMSYQQVLSELKAAGLATIPGGGAEIFAPRVRRKICDDKATADEWIEIHRTAHRLGIKSNATMLYGHIENAFHRTDHLLRLRELQDETKHFLTFTPLCFHPEGTELEDIQHPTADDDLRNIAVARLMLDNFEHKIGRAHV